MLASNACHHATKRAQPCDAKAKQMKQWTTTCCVCFLFEGATCVASQRGAQGWLLEVTSELLAHAGALAQCWAHCSIEKLVVRTVLLMA